MTLMRARIQKYRRTDSSDRTDFVIGCRILTRPFFFEESSWLPVPDDWSRNIVTFKPTPPTTWLATDCGKRSAPGRHWL
jgi:hypothetical protein